MGLIALMVVRESFENERIWCVDILCRSNHRKANWQGRIVMGERSKEAARWRVCIAAGYAGRLKRKRQKIMIIMLCRRKNNFKAFVG